MSTPITALTEEHARLLAGGASAMTINGADMAAGTFAGVAWSELTFTACDFTGVGNIQLTAMSNCSFVGCNFLACEHDFGVMTQVSFTQCKSAGRAVFGGRDGSSGLVFEHCTFSGAGSAPEEFEGIGATGEVRFSHCKGSGAVLVAGTKLHIEHCQFHNMTFAIGRQSQRGLPLAATVLIDNSHGTGRWRMVDCRMKHSHIHNTHFEELVDSGSECEAKS